MYDSVVKVSTIPIITSNVAEALPPAIRAAATKTIVAITPERKLTLTGVPSFAEKRPRMRGPAPSYEATAWLRSEPISHVQALETRARTKPNAAIFVITLAAPPQTLKTAATAVMKPSTPVISSLGSTAITARIGRP